MSLVEDPEDAHRIGAYRPWYLPFRSKTCDADPYVQLLPYLQFLDISANADMIQIPEGLRLCPCAMVDSFDFRKRQQ